MFDEVSECMQTKAGGRSSDAVYSEWPICTFLCSGQFEICCQL